MSTTMGDEFNRVLEIQQSKNNCIFLRPRSIWLISPACTPDLVAGVDLSTQESAIRSFLYQEVPMMVFLRLLSIYSQVNGGIKPKVLDEFQRDFLQVHIPP
jgi:hypothetical protein